MSFFGCRPIQDSPQKSPLSEEKVDSSPIELPLNAESYTQPEDSRIAIVTVAYEIFVSSL